MLDRSSIHDRALGRWKGILAGIGVDPKYLTGKNVGCPLCKDGKDRFRFDDKEARGTWICTHCGAGSGVDFVMKFRGMAFLDAVREIEKHLGSATVSAPKAKRDDAAQRDQMTALWRMAKPLDGQDIASRYLRRRGIELASWPLSVRWIAQLPHWDDAKVKTLHPAMLAKVTAPDGKPGILHRTYLAEPGVKAAIAKPRMLMPGNVPVGGAVRLGDSLETMGIGEGIESCLSASILWKVPVWAALSASFMMRWKAPPEAKNIIIFGDLDDNFAGQMAAYNLAFRLKSEKLDVEVRFPDREEGRDWNDVLASRMEKPP